MNLNKMLGTKYPIIQGGMANIATGAFVAIVSNAGALGLIGTGSMNADEVREQIRLCKSLTDKPFGINIMLLNPEAEKIAQVAIEEKVKVVTTGAGNPSAYIKSWKENGIIVIPVVSAVVLAKRMEQMGADAVIMEGTEAGGHIGEATTMAVLPQVVKEVNIPVIAAGGIATGEQMLAAYVLGACGVQIGTCLLASEECPIHQNYKDAVISANHRDVVVTGRINGTPVRLIKNNMAKNYINLEKLGADKTELEEFTLGSLRKAVFDGNIKEGSLMAGQVVGLVNEIKAVKEILDTMMQEYNERLNQIKAEN